MAADEIHMSRQALSKIISDLEIELGKKLFVRMQNGVTPTQAADELVPRIQVILRECDKLYEETRMESLKAKKLTICTFDAFTCALSPEFFKKFIREYPCIMLNFEETTDEHAKDQLLQNQCDFAIVTDAVNYTNFSHTKLFHVPYGVFVSKNNPLASKNIILCRDLESEKMIGKTHKLKYYDRDLSLVFDQGNNMNFIIETTNNGATRNLIRNNVGIGIAWNYNLFYDMDDGIVFRTVVDMAHGMDIYLLENTKGDNAIRRQVFKDYLLHWIKEQIPSSF